MTRIQCLLFVILLAFTPENGTRDGTGKQRFSCSSFAEAAVMNTGIAEPRALTDGKGTDTANDASKEESRRRYQDAMAAFQRKATWALHECRRRMKADKTLAEERAARDRTLEILYEEQIRNGFSRNLTVANPPLMIPSSVLLARAGWTHSTASRGWNPTLSEGSKRRVVEEDERRRSGKVRRSMEEEADAPKLPPTSAARNERVSSARGEEEWLKRRERVWRIVRSRMLMPLDQTLEPQRPLLFSIWLQPPGPEGRRLQLAASRLARQHRAPLLPVHIPLLDGLTASDAHHLASRIRDAVAGCGAVRISVDSGVREGSHASRTLFLPVGPPRPLEALHARLLSALRSFLPPGSRGNADGSDRPFLPHLALLRAKWPPDKTRAVARQAAAALAELPRAAPFLCPSLHLFCTAGPSEDWFEVAVCPLG